MPSKTPTWIKRYETYLSQQTDFKANTIKQHWSALNLLEAWMTSRKVRFESGNLDRIKKHGILAALDNDGLRDYFAYLRDEKHLKSTSRTHAKSALKHYYMFLYDYGHLEKKLDFKFPILRNGNDRRVSKEYLTEGDIISIRKGATESPRTALMVECMIKLGVRLHELLALRPMDFYEDKNQVFIQSTKTEHISKYGGERWMILLPGLIEDVRKYSRHIIDDEPIFKIGSRRVQSIIADLGKKVGINIHPHIFRHYTITRFTLMTGEDGATPLFSIQELSLIFGVSPEVIMETYSHPTTGDVVTKALKAKANL